MTGDDRGDNSRLLKLVASKCTGSPTLAAKLILHDQVRAVFQRSLQFARQTRYLKGRRM